MKRFVGRVALVTGAGSGIGRGIALAFASEGARVVVNDLKLSAAETVAAEVEAAGSQSLAVAADITGEIQVRDMVRSALDSFGSIDILVNNAGGGVTVPVVEMTAEEWDFTMNVNARGTFLCSREVARHMIESRIRGRIINISSQAGKTGALFMGAYCASKAAILAFTQVLGLELARYGINVNAICPGVVDTPMLQDLLNDISKRGKRTPEQVLKSMLSVVPLGRLETPEDIAGVAKFLASDDASYMTGQAINVTGGMERH